MEIRCNAIAARFGVPAEAIIAANDITDPTLIVVGEELILPASAPSRPTPIPTRAVTARGLSAAENAYIEEIITHALTTGEALTELGALTSDPQIGNDRWTLKVGAQIATVQLAYEEVAKLKPTAKFKEVHAKVLSAFLLYTRR